MPNKAASVCHLCDISDALGLVRTPAMPYLIVEHDNASRFSKVILNFVLPLRLLLSDSEAMRRKDVNLGQLLYHRVRFQ